jgi:hypothetical protein
MLQMRVHGRWNLSHLVLQTPAGMLGEIATTGGPASFPRFLQASIGAGMKLQ